MPTQKITFKKGSPPTIYVYQTVRAYRNALGKPTSDEVLIGRKDLQTGMLIPNDRYFSLRGQSPAPLLPDHIESSGATTAFLHIAHTIGLLPILKQTFPQNWRQLFTYAQYMVCEGNVMQHCLLWNEHTKTITDDISSPGSSELFASLSFASRMAFFRMWIAANRGAQGALSAYVAYDVSSVSTYARGIDQAEWGYNRDQENLRQINIGMFFGEAVRLPVFYNWYSGSITDKADLTFMMRYAGELGIGKVRFVLDQGFVTQGNCKYMYGKEVSFVTCLPHGRLEAQNIIAAVADRLKQSAHWIAEYQVYGVSIPYTLYGIPLTAHVIVNPDKEAADIKKLYAWIEQAEQELSRMEGRRTLPKRYSRFFDRKEGGKGRPFYYARNHSKIDEEVRRAGMMVFITTDGGLSTGEIIGWYRQRDVIEKAFDNLKNELDFHRLRTHLNETTDGKLFVAFLALILRTGLLNHIAALPRKGRPSGTEAILELKKIKALTFNGKGVYLSTLTAMQKKILASIGLAPDVFEQHVVSGFSQFLSVS
jgi:transposase